MDPTGEVYTLTPAILREGRNVITVYATRFTPAEKKMQAFHWNGPGHAAVQFTVPAPPWQRSVFHGLAQVIVQSTGQAGEIHLTASTPGAASSSIVIAAERSKP
jgi:beta-galactosidase